MLLLLFTSLATDDAAGGGGELVTRNELHAITARLSALEAENAALRQRLAHVESMAVHQDLKKPLEAASVTAAGGTAARSKGRRLYAAARARNGPWHAVRCPRVDTCACGSRQGCGNPNVRGGQQLAHSRVP